MPEGSRSERRQTPSILEISIGFFVGTIVAVSLSVASFGTDVAVGTVGNSISFCPMVLVEVTSEVCCTVLDGVGATVTNGK